MADALNAALYAGRGDWAGAGISLLGVIPFVGDAATMGRVAARAADGLAAAAREMQAVRFDFARGYNRGSNAALKQMLRATWMNPIPPPDGIIDGVREAIKGAKARQVAAATVHLNSNNAVSKFGLYEIRIDGKLYKVGKADLQRITQSTGSPTRLHQQLRKLRGEHGKKAVIGEVVEDLGEVTTSAAKNAEKARLSAYYRATGEVPEGNTRSFKPDP